MEIGQSFNFETVSNLKTIFLQIIVGKNASILHSVHFIGLLTIF